MKCYTCDQEGLVKKKAEYKQFGISLGTFNALYCPACKETFFDGHVMEQIEKKAKQLGIWGLARKSRIGTSGSSLDVKLPKQIAEFLKLKKGQEIIIEPLERKKIGITIV